MFEEQLQEKNLIEILGLENFSDEAQDQVIAVAMETVELQCLGRILDSLDEEGKKHLENLFETQKEIEIFSFLDEKGIDVVGILEEEIQRYKETMASKIAGG